MHDTRRTICKTSKKFKENYPKFKGLYVPTYGLTRTYSPYTNEQTELQTNGRNYVKTDIKRFPGNKSLCVDSSRKATQYITRIVFYDKNVIFLLLCYLNNGTK